MTGARSGGKTKVIKQFAKSDFKVAASTRTVRKLEKGKAPFFSPTKRALQNNETKWRAWRADRHNLPAANMFHLCACNVSRVLKEISQVTHFCHGDCCCCCCFAFALFTCRISRHSTRVFLHPTPPNLRLEGRRRRRSGFLPPPSSSPHMTGVRFRTASSRCCTSQADMFFLFQAYVC